MHFKPIKVCYVIDTLDIGGTEKQIVDTIKGMDLRKVTPYLVCLRNSKMVEDMKDNHCTTLVLNINSLISFKSFLKLFKFCSFLLRERVDIVQTYFIDATIFGVVAAKLAGVKKNISCRRDMGYWYTKNKLSFFRFFNRFVDRFLVNSEAIKKNIINFEKIPEDKINVIYNGIDMKYFNKTDFVSCSKIKEQLKIPHNNIVIGCIANLNRIVKRVDVFIKASAIVSQSIENVSFLIIGDGCLHNELVELAAALNVGDKIIFGGQRNDIASLLQIIDIGVLTSDSEGFSNSILEYMAAGIPTVATNAGGNRELIDNNIDGFLVPSDNPQLTADAIVKLINDEKLRVMMGNSSKQKVHQRFSLDKMIKNLESYYSNMLNH